jgi:hypothetical protein
MTDQQNKKPGIARLCRSVATGDAQCIAVPCICIRMVLK